MMIACSGHGSNCRVEDSEDSDSLISHRIILDEGIGYFTTDGRTPDSMLPHTNFTILHYVSSDDCIACDKTVTGNKKVHFATSEWLVPFWSLLIK